MARKTTYVDLDSPKRKSTGSSQYVRWFEEPKETVANAVQALASGLETGGAYTGNLYMSYVCSRLLTNRSSPAGFGYSMVRRVGRAAQSMVSATWTPPTVNTIGMASDVFHRKVFKNRTWLQFMPTVKGTYKYRSRCKALSQFVDAAFDQLDVWSKVEMCGTDVMQYPSAYIKVGSGVDDKLKIDRVLWSEVLLTPEQAGSWSTPRSILQRVFIPKADLRNSAKGHENEAQLISAIDHASGVYPGFYSSIGTDYAEIAALVEGWSLPLPDGTPGRHVLTIGDYCIFDKPWKRKRLPFAKFDFVKLSNEYCGQSCAEILLPMQRYIDRLSAAIDEIEQRFSWPRWFVETASHVDTDQFGADFVEYTNTAPTKDNTNSVPPELHQRLVWAIETALRRVGITMEAASGKKPEGLSSGLAIMAQAQVDDSVHVDLAQRFEDFVVDIGEIIIEECAELKPTFEIDGKQAIKWEDVEMNRNMFKMTAFPMSRLPQQISARYEMINGWYLDGTISRAEKLRLQNMPDTQTTIDAMTSSADWVENALDEIIDKGKYIPPLPYLDIKSAQQTAQARFVREHLLGLEESRLRTINKFIAALRELQPPPAPAMVPMGAPGPQPMPGMASAGPGLGAPMPTGPVAGPQQTASPMVGQA